MSKYMLTLKEAELADLITSAVLDIREQRIGYDVMIDAQMKRDYGGDGSSGGDGLSIPPSWEKAWERSIPKEFLNYFEREFGKVKDLYNPGSEDSYHHGINQTAAIVCYAVGALCCYFGKNVQMKMLCVELEVLAILIEMIDFQQYMEEGDYYNAGLVAAFVWFPIGRLSVKGLKTLFPKAFQAALNKFIRMKSTPKKLFDYLIRTEGQAFVSKLAQTMKKHPKLLWSVKSAKNKVMSTWKALHKMITTPPWWLPTSVVKGLTNIINYILKPLYKILEFLIVIMGMVSLYDPAMIAPVFSWAGKKWDITTFNSLSDWLESLAEDDYGGVQIWHNILRVSGSVDGAITTTRIDCDLDFYVWDDVVEAFKNTPYHKYEIRSHGIVKDGVNLTGLWEKWQQGWRPDIAIDPEDFSAATDANLEKKMKENTQKTYKLTLWSDMKKLEQHENWFIENGLEVEKWEDFVAALQSCEEWLKFSDTKKSKEIVPHIKAMSKSPNFPGDK